MSSVCELVCDPLHISICESESERDQVGSLSCPFDCPSRPSSRAVNYWPRPHSGVILRDWPILKRAGWRAHLMMARQRFYGLRVFGGRPLESLANWSPARLPDSVANLRGRVCAEGIKLIELSAHNTANSNLPHTLETLCPLVSPLASSSRQALKLLHCGFSYNKYILPPWPAKLASRFGFGCGGGNFQKAMRAGHTSRRRQRP